jgi:LysM repeat protein
MAARVAALAVFLFAVWEVGGYVLQKTAPVAAAQPTQAQVTPTHLADFDLPELQPFTAFGITRLALLHTYRPERPRFDLSTYTVVSGDTVFGIADKFKLKPSTIMWSNFDILGDDSDMIVPGMKLNILPEDGAVHTWMKNEGLNKVASYFHVTPQDILDWPGNNLTAAAVGDFANPNIPVGTQLVIPGGWREFISKVAAIPRTSPGVGSYLGPGVCQNVSSNAMGTGAFVWPVHGTITTQFTPDAGHPAIDIATALGTPVVAADTGVIVYAGWSTVGFGNLVIIDHGNGWQTLYGHLNAIYVSCGAGVYQGGQIGVIGSTGNSTGPHLHFQMESSQYGKVNPLNYLPAG